MTQMPDLEGMVDRCKTMIDRLPSLAEHKAVKIERDQWKEAFDRSCDDIVVLRADRAALIKALEPFAKLADEIDERWPDHTGLVFADFTPDLTAGDLRTARAALRAALSASPAQGD